MSVFRKVGLFCGLTMTVLMLALCFGAVVHADELDEKASIEAVLKESPEAVVMVYAPWCQVCKRMYPVFEAVEQELGGQYRFVSVDLGDYGELTSKWNINYVPTFLMMKNGKEVARIVGSVSQQEMVDAVKDTFGS